MMCKNESFRPSFPTRILNPEDSSGIASSRYKPPRSFFTPVEIFSGSRKAKFYGLNGAPIYFDRVLKYEQDSIMGREGLFANPPSIVFVKIAFFMYIPVL